MDQLSLLFFTQKYNSFLLVQAAVMAALTIPIERVLNEAVAHSNTYSLHPHNAQVQGDSPLPSSTSMAVLMGHL